LAARVERIVPRLEESLPNAALATAAGGSTPLDPTDPNHNRTLGRVLQLDLALDLPREGSALFGERAFVRFSHGEEPLAERLWRGLRQTFMGRFAI
jgi:putative peptide zinc metalloprotease protein